LYIDLPDFDLENCRERYDPESKCIIFENFWIKPRKRKMNKRYCNRCGQLEDREKMRIVTLTIHREAEYFSILCPKCIAELKDFYNKRK